MADQRGMSILPWHVVVELVALLLLGVSCSNPAPAQVSEPTAAESTEVPAPLEEAPPTTLLIEGSTVVIVGVLDFGFYARFFSLVRDREDEIATIRVNSGGGVTDEGLKLGGWMVEHNVDVVVDELCFSSCANYIFTAGKNKIIMADSIVGWHGSEQQEEHIARGLGITVEELLAREYDEYASEWGGTPSPAGRKRFVEDILSRMPDAVREEQAFLENVGVSVDALVYGFLPDQFEGYYVNTPPQINGWTFSIEDMASFGIDSVTYAGDGDYPSERAKREYGVIVFKVR